MTTKNLVLRSMYIDPDVDDQLRTEAFDSRTSKNDLLRKYLRLGMEAAKKTGVARKPAVKKAAPAPAATAAVKASLRKRKSAVVTTAGKTRARPADAKKTNPAKPPVTG